MKKLLDAAGHAIGVVVGILIITFIFCLPLGLLLLFYFAFHQQPVKEVLTLALDYIRVLIWPIVALVLAGRFRTQIEALFGRAKKITTPGVSAEFDSLSDQKGVVVSQGAEAALQALGDKQQAYNELLQTATSVNEERNQFEILYLLEKIYNIIVGPQIKLLKILNIFAPMTWTMEEMTNFIDEQIKSSYPEFNGIPGSAFPDFLLQNGLVEVNEDNYKISEGGKLFLQYLQNQNYGDKES